MYVEFHADFKSAFNFFIGQVEKKLEICQNHASGENGEKCGLAAVIFFCVHIFFYNLVNI